MAVDAWGILADVALVLAAACTAAVLAEKLGLSPIVGYLLAGAFLGPGGLGLVHRGPLLLGLAELGVTLLLFVIGLELPKGGLGGMGKRALAAGLLQVLLTTGAVAGAATVFGVSWPKAVVLGLVVAPSSTAVVLRILGEKTLLDSVAGRAGLAILLVQDLALVPSVFLVGRIGRGSGLEFPGLFGFGRSLLWFAFGSLLLFLFFRYGVPYLLGQLHGVHQREAVLLIAVSSVLAAALGAHGVGVTPALGAFVAGALMAKSPFAPQVRADLGSLRTLFLAVFFVAIGTLSPWDLALGNWKHLTLGLLAVLALKAFLVAAILLALGYRRGPALATGLFLGQLGEFSFVLAELAYRTGLLDEALLARIIALTTGSLLVTPALIALGDKLARLTSPSSKAGPQGTAGELGPDRKPWCLVVGLGPAGQTVAQRLQQLGWRVVAVESSPEGLARAKQLGLPVLIGDARHSEVLAQAGAKEAALAVVTVPDPFAAKQILETLRSLHSGIPIVVRGRYAAFAAFLRQGGATRVVNEEVEVGEALARACLELMEKRER